MMSDKTPLERDIETRELSQTPGIIKLFILLLLSGVVVLALYSFVLKQEIVKKEQKITLMQEKYQNEKSALLEELKELRTRVNADVNSDKQEN